MAPPFMNASGLVTKIFDKIIEAQQPERFTQDYLGTKLGFPSGSAKPIIPMMKRLGFLGSDGVPTKLYAQFRNPDTRGLAMAEAIRNGYKDVYERNEYAHDLSKEKFKNLRGGPGCLNRFSASISGVSAGVRLPSGLAAG